MKELDRQQARAQKAGGVAALYLAGALLAAMPYFLLVVNYPSATTIAEKVALVSSNYASMYAVYLGTYVIYGLALGVLAFALHDRLQGRAPAMMRVTTAIGLLWSVALVTSGMIWNYGMTTVVSLARTDPAQAQSVWQSVEAVSEALGGAGGEILGGLWVLLLSVVALRSGALPRLVSWLGMAVGAIGLISVVPPLHDAAIAFGLLQIVWFLGIGVALLRTRMASAEERTARPQPAMPWPAEPAAH